jgi:hypothetical protein
MNRQEKMAILRERRLKTSIEAVALAKEFNLTKEETNAYLFDADSNAIWDGEANMPYRSPKPPVTSTNILMNNQLPIYSAEEFCKKQLIKK